jgi:hypothetical protein
MFRWRTLIWILGWSLTAVLVTGNDTPHVAFGTAEGAPAQSHFTVTQYYLLTLQSQGETLLNIRPNGDLEYGPHYTPDAAAQVFWETVAGVPLEWRRRRCEGVPFLLAGR